MIGGMEFSQKVHESEALLNLSIIPIVSTASGVARILIAVGLLAFNALRSIGLAVAGSILALAAKPGKAKYFEHAEDSLKAVAYNAGAIALGVLEAIPFVGSTIGLCRGMGRLTAALSFG